MSVTRVESESNLLEAGMGKKKDKRPGWERTRLGRQNFADGGRKAASEWALSSGGAVYYDVPPTTKEEEEEEGGDKARRKRMDVKHSNLYDATPDHSILKNGLAKSTSRPSILTSVTETDETRSSDDTTTTSSGGTWRLNFSGASPPSPLYDRVAEYGAATSRKAPKPERKPPPLPSGHPPPLPQGPGGRGSSLRPSDSRRVMPFSTGKLGLASALSHHGKQARPSPQVHPCQLGLPAGPYVSGYRAGGESVSDATTGSLGKHIYLAILAVFC